VTSRSLRQRQGKSRNRLRRSAITSITALCFPHKMVWAVRNSSPSIRAARLFAAQPLMSGTRHSDTHVQYELDTATWMGPFEPRHTPFAVVKEAAELIVAGGLKAEALPDARPAQWSKLIFNASVNGVSALTGLPHSPHFADETRPASLDTCSTT